jgi:Arc/MetJ family transcription regulator
MATNLQIDDSLIQKAVTLGGHKTKKAAVTKALIEYIDHLEQEKILKMFGTVDYDPGYDYKEQRRRS